MDANSLQQTQSFDAKRFFSLVGGRLDERARREVAAAAALSFGQEGVALVQRLTGMSARAIKSTADELTVTADGCGDSSCAGKGYSSIRDGSRPV